MRCALLIGSVMWLACFACSEDKPSSQPESESKPTDMKTDDDPAPDKPDKPADNTPIPEVGSRIEGGGSEWVVVAAGRDAFDYTAGEVGVAIGFLGDAPGATVIGTLAPDKGATIKVDPSIPMLWVNGQEHRFFKDSAAIKRDTRDKVLLLLELPP